MTNLTTFEELADTYYLLSQFFWDLEYSTEKDYENGKITRKKKNELIKSIRESWDATMKENDPLTKNNPRLREIADSLS